MRRLMQESLWLRFSAENQKWFDRRWHHMRKLTPRWFVFVCIAPMVGPVVLPRDFLALGDRTWVVCYGEEGDGWRYMNPNWARAVKRQCREHGIPFSSNSWPGRGPVKSRFRTTYASGNFHVGR
jgi:protein gp37